MRQHDPLFKLLLQKLFVEFLEAFALDQKLDNILDAREKRNVMELMTSWERKGRAEGELALIKRQLKRRIGAVDPAIEKKLGRLTLQRLESLAEALLDFTGPQDSITGWQTVRTDTNVSNSFG